MSEDLEHKIKVYAREAVEFTLLSNKYIAQMKIMVACSKLAWEQARKEGKTDDEMLKLMEAYETLQSAKGV